MAMAINGKSGHTLHDVYVLYPIATTSDYFSEL